MGDSRLFQLENRLYLFPRHDAEGDRLDLQHHVLRETLGANHLAPVAAPRRILDSGCGTGQWAFEACDHFPAAMVVGLDLMASKPGPPPRYRWVQADLLDTLPFCDGTFDFAHQRMLATAVPLKDWPTVVSELARVTRPGGWVELVEMPWVIEEAGPATRRLLGLVQHLAAARGLDGARAVYDSIDEQLRAVGLECVERRELAVPVGAWGGRVGSFAATDMRATFARVCELPQAERELSRDECRELVRECQLECERGHMAWPVAVAFGQKR